MQKKLIAVAVAGALGAPALAFAQASTVQVYGTMYMEYSRIDQGRPVAGGPERVTVDMLQSPGSNVGFKGEERLGGGMSAWFQCESTADIRGQTQDGWCSRNSALGLKGAFGNIWVGNWDAPFKRVFGVNRITNETGIWGNSFLMTGGSTTVFGPALPGLWVRRVNNSINYDSPNFAGFQVMLATTALNHATGNLDNSPIAKPRQWSIGATYTAGPLNVGAAYEVHKDFNPSGANAANPLASGDDKAWLLSAGYTYGPVKIGVIYTKQEWDTASGAAAAAGGTRTDGDLAAWQIAADWKIAGPHGLRAAYTVADDTEGSHGTAAAPLTIAGSSSLRVFNGGAGNTGAKLWQISYVNTMSKRTEATIGYARLDNDAQARYAIGGVSAPAAGEDQNAWGISLRHRF
jgi:predicted porin